MANKKKALKYGEFRIFMEYLGRGKYRINPAFVPSMSAWLLMHGRVYQRAIDGMRQKLAQDTIVGLKECCEALEKCQAHLQRLMDSLTNNFDKMDWYESVQVISALLGIEPDSTPLEWIPPGKFAHVISEEPSDGADTGGG